MTSEEYSITIEKLMKVVHTYTDPIRIKVVMGDAWRTCEEAKRMRDFTLVESFCDRCDDRDKQTKERLMKYYKDVPVWNLTVWLDDCHAERGSAIYYGIEARCYYKDLREGWLAEQNDIRREKQRAYRKAYKERRRQGDEQ